MLSSTETKDISQPNAILLKDNYPTAPTIITSINKQDITIPTLEYEIVIKEQETTLLSTNTKKTMYYFNEYLKQNEQEQVEKNEIFYNSYKKPIWKLINRDWHGISLNYKDNTIILSTTPPNFRFTFNKQFYHWQIIKGENLQYKLKCYETETKKLIAQLDQNKLLLDILPAIIINKEQDTTITTSSSTNPFRKSSNTSTSTTATNDTTTSQTSKDDPFTTFIILSGLLVNNHIKSLLKSLGGGNDALNMMIDPPATINNNYKGEHPTMLEEEEEEDDIASLSSTYKRHYSGHQSLVDDRGGNRWSSAQSFKSIELDPGVWHCWWGYKFWWSWFPCCMPGGCCDRACIKLKGHKTNVGSNKRTLSKQGWKQQHY